MPEKLSGRKFLWSGLALVCAALLAVLAHSISAGGRFTNLELSGSGIRDTYIMADKSDDGRCLVLNRRKATVRRSDKKLPGRKWDYVRFAAAEGLPEVWLVRSKRKGKGTVFFVPVEMIGDWSYPFFYGFVRGRREDLELPEVFWTQLFVDRIYQGLYLRVGLPFDLRKKDGRSGVLREILTVRGNRMLKVDTRFNDACRLYTGQVARGLFPDLISPDPVLAWLSAYSPAEGTTFLMSNQSPYKLSLLPVPVSLEDLHEAMTGRFPDGFSDERFRKWTSEVEEARPARPPLAEDEFLELKADFEDFKRSFRRALKAHGESYRSWPRLSEWLPSRQAMAGSLDLEI